MNHYFVFLFYFIFLLINISLESEFYEIETLLPDLEITVNSSVGMIYFESSSFQIDDEIELLINASSFKNNKIQYKFIDYNNYHTFIDDNDKQTLKSKSYSLEANATKNIDENGQKYVYKYFIIKKDLKKFDILYGNYLIIFFECEGKVTIKNGKNLKNSIILGEPKTTDDGILKKYGTIKVSGTDGGIIFDSSEFKEGEDMFFKIEALIFYDNNIYYEFVDDLSTYYPSPFYYNYFSAYYTNTDYDGSYEIHYYTITKDKAHLGNLKGKYLIIFFECSGFVTITNTKENEGNISTIIAVIVVIIVVIGIGVLIYYCIRRRKNAQMIQMTNAQVNQVYNQNNMNQNNNMYNTNIMNQNNIIYNQNNMIPNYNPNPNNNNQNINININVNQNKTNSNRNQNNQNNYTNSQGYNSNIINQNNNLSNLNQTNKGYSSNNSNQNYNNYNTNNLDHNNKGYSSNNIEQNNNNLNNLNQNYQGYCSNNLNQNNNMDIELNSKNQMNLNAPPINDNAAPDVGYTSKP